MSTEEDFIAGYDASAYERPSVTADVLAFQVGTRPASDARRLPTSELRVLLVRRADHPFRGDWALPGGFAEMEETLEATAVRELAEETGVVDAYVEQLYTWGDPGRDPRTRVVTVSFMALLPKDAAVAPVAGSDAHEAAWFSIERTVDREKVVTLADGSRETTRDISVVLRQVGGDATVRACLRTRKGRLASKTPAASPDIEVTGRGLAFDHDKVLAYALDRLASKLEWTDAAFNLMGDTFTLAELRQVYELVLEHPLTTPNFRRKVLPLVEGTGILAEEGAHRPAELYRRNRSWEGGL